MPVSDDEASFLVKGILEDAVAFRKGSTARFDQICFKFDIKGSAKKELYAFMCTHFKCIDELVDIFNRIR